MIFKGLLTDIKNPYVLHQPSESKNTVTIGQLSLSNVCHHHDALRPILLFTISTPPPLLQSLIKETSGWHMVIFCLKNKTFKLVGL